MIKMKNILSFILVLIALLFINNTKAFNWNELEEKFDTAINIIINNNIEKNWIEKTYEKINTFNQKIIDFPNKNYKIDILWDVVYDNMNKLEKKFFNVENENKIYVSDINNPYTFFQWKKVKIYNHSNQNTELKKYTVCDINNKEICVLYPTTLFVLTDKLINIYPEFFEYENNSYSFSDNGIYKNKITQYFNWTENIVNNIYDIDIYLKSLDYENKELYFWWNFINLKDLWFLENNGVKNLWIKEKVLIANIDKSKLWFFNEDGLIQWLFRDYLYLSTIKNEDFYNVRKIVNKEETLEQSYDKIKWLLEYDTEVYDYYLATNNVKESHHYSFSWIGWLREWKAVCSWYVSLLQQYLSLTNNYNSINIKDWYYINSTDWNLIPHSWIEINGKYYDITFDDWLSNIDKNLYYNLEKDLMYADRVWENDFETKKNLEEMSANERIWFVHNNYFKLSNKYNNELLNPYKILKQKWINNYKEMTLNNLFNSADNRYYVTINSNWSIDYRIKDDNGNKYNIKAIEMVELSNIDSFISYVLINWFKSELTMAVNEEDWKFYIIKKLELN